MPRFTELENRVLVQSLREYLNARVPDVHDGGDIDLHVQEYISRRYGAHPPSFQERQFDRLRDNIATAMGLLQELSS